MRGLLPSIPMLAFVAALMAASFAGGAAVMRHRVFPYGLLENAYKSAGALLGLAVESADHSFLEFAAASSRGAAAGRIELIGGQALEDRILFSGGRWLFAELCPGDGCLAVEYERDGEPAHAYPFRLSEYERAVIVDEPHELPIGFSLPDHAHVGGLARYANGDLLLTLHSWNSFPYAFGAARVDRGGVPIWRRSDYSHHHPSIVDKSGVALVPSLRIDGDLSAFKSRLDPSLLERMERCNNGQGPYFDSVNLLDGSGRLLREIPVLEALLDSPYASVLLHATDACDPTHLNFAHQVGPDADDASGAAPGDIVVSLRNISAVATLDKDDGALKRLIRGTFAQQHAARHLAGSQFLMMDNQGAGSVSRLLLIDIANGRETTVFPNERTDPRLQGLYTGIRGHVEASADRRRAIVTYSDEGVAVEVRLADGEVLAAFRSLHDVSDVDAFGGERRDNAALFSIRGVYYASNSEE